MPRRVVPALVAGLAVVSLAACSSSKHPTVAKTDNLSVAPVTLLEEAVGLAAKASTFTVTATNQDPGNPLQLHARFALNGYSGAVNQNGQIFDVTVVGTRAYLKGSDALFTTVLGPKSSVKLASTSGKWIAMSASGAAFKRSNAALVPNTLLPRQLSASDLAGLVKVAGRTFNGVPTVGVEHSADSSIAYIQRYGSPYLIVGVSSTNGIGVSLEYSDWNVPYETVPPPAADVVNLPAGS